MDRIKSAAKSSNNSNGDGAILSVSASKLSCLDLPQRDCLREHVIYKIKFIQRGCCCLLRAAAAVFRFAYRLSCSSQCKTVEIWFDRQGCEFLASTPGLLQVRNFLMLGMEAPVCSLDIDSIKVVRAPSFELSFPC